MYDGVKLWINIKHIQEPASNWSWLVWMRKEE